MKFKKNIINNFESNRIITLGEINNENATQIISFILELNKNQNNNKPIELIITSGGGNVYEGFGIIDAINNSTIPIHTTCYGLGMSMALPILISGHHRKMSSNATLMYHDISYNIEENKLQHHINELKETKRISKKYEKIIINNSNITKDQLHEIKKQQKEWYITPKQALKLGLIDEII